MVVGFENSRHPVFRGISPLGSGILKKKNNRDTIHFNWEYCNIDLLFTEQSHSGVESMSRETSPSRHESARKTPRDIQIKQEDLKSLVDIPKQPQASGNRMLQNLRDFNSMPFVTNTEYLRTTAKFYHPVEKGNHYITTTLEDDEWRKCTSICTEYTTPRNREDSRPYASIDANQEIGPVLTIGIATVMDVPGIEVQVPSLSTPRMLRMDFDMSWSRKICERNSSSQLQHCELLFLAARFLLTS